MMKAPADFNLEIYLLKEYQGRAINEKRTPTTCAMKASTHLGGESEEKSSKKCS
jgi:hypothetical protein